MSSKLRILLALTLIALMGAILTVAVTLKASDTKRLRIEDRVLTRLVTKIAAQEAVSPYEETIAKANRYAVIKGRAFANLTDKKKDEALALLEWIRERSEEDPQIDFYLAQAWKLKGDNVRAGQFYARVVENSSDPGDIAAALEDLGGDGKSYVSTVRDFIIQHNKGDRFAKILKEHEKSSTASYRSDKAFVLVSALYVVEGDQPNLIKLLASVTRRHADSPILKPYIKADEKGGVVLDIIRFGDDLVGKDNPQRKETVKITTDIAARLAKELKGASAK